MNITTRILIVIIIQTLILFTLIGLRQYTLNTGTVIRLETTPIDPRSLLSGDYVSLNYKIREIPISVSSEKSENWQVNDTAYAVLAPKGSYWVVESISHSKPDVQAPKIAIKGRVDYSDANHVYLKYGIEDYFVPEGEGRKIERPKPGDKIEVNITIDRFGNAAIAGVLINNKKVYQETLF